MKITGRDKLVLAASARVLLWLVLLCWALSYSFWLGAAFSIYAALSNKLGLYSPESLKTFRRNL
ncbi:MAG TPA: hypothetical protein VKB12_18140 [Pyrinomonadaceae bacterium]|nr:hypothetical protein [Pyrinomonadaceae bacterium]